MNIYIDKEELQTALALASKFTISRFTTTTHLQGVLLKAENKELHVISTDLNLFFHKKIKIKETTSLRVIVEPKTIVEYLSFIESGDVSLEIKENKLIVSKEKDKGSFPTIDAADFPSLPNIEKEKIKKIETKFLIENLPLVLFSASSDEARPSLTGIKFINQGDETTMVSTDGFRLSLVRGHGGGAIGDVLIPGRLLEEVLKESKDKKEIVQGFSDEDKTVMFGVGDCEFYSRLIEGEFPAFEKVLPSESKTKITIDKEELLQKTRRVSVFAREYSNIIIFDIKKDGIYFNPKTDSGQSESSAFQEAEVDGDLQKVAFNFRFIQDFLNNSNAKKITIEVLRPDAPVVFKEDNKKNYIHIIMPVRINAE